jgi:hypothetical protein
MTKENQTMFTAAAWKTIWPGALLAFGSPLWAQNGAPVSNVKLFENAYRVNVTMTLDRQDYLPGELAELTITITNSTPQVLDIPRPFSVGTGALLLLERRRARPGEHPYREPGWLPAEVWPDVAPRRGPEVPLPSIRIGPGETISRKFLSWDQSAEPPGWGRLIYGGSTPTWAGDFRLEYWGGHVEFRVMRPALVALSKIYLPEWEDFVVDSQGRTEKRQRRTFAFVLEAEGRHYVCLFKRTLPFELDPMQTDSAGRLRDKALRMLCPYTRLAESDSAVSPLRAESDANGTITIQWGANGEGYRRLLPDDWRIPPPKAPGGNK